MSLHLNGQEQIWKITKMVFTPLALAPDRFVNILKSARKDALGAKNAREAASCRQEHNSPRCERCDSASCNDAVSFLQVESFMRAVGMMPRTVRPL